MFEAKISYPNEEQVQDSSEFIQKRQELVHEAAADSIMDRYESFLRQGYDVSPSIKLSDEVELDPFEFAEKLEKSGIDYKASLKFKNKSNQGTYEEVRKIAQMIESHGFDFDVSIKLKINDKSAINFDRESSWFGPDAVYTISPKVTVDSIKELKGTYDDLVKMEVDVAVDIRPAKANESTFKTYLATFPEGSIVSMSLKDAEM